MNIKSFIKECHEKEVFKMLSIYVISCWVGLQVLAVIQDYVGLPDIFITIVLILMLIGFPIHVFNIWRFRLAKHEIELEEVDDKGRKKKSKFHRMYYSALFSVSLLTTLIVVLIVNNKFFIQPDIPEIEASDKIAILKFGNNTGDTKFDVVSKMASDWIMHGITENQIAQVVSPQNVENYSNLLKASTASLGPQTILKDYFKPKKTISGNFFLKDNKLLFQSAIEDEESTFAFHPVECDKENPLECIESLKQVILSYLIRKEELEEEDFEIEMDLQDFPPKFEAYQAVLEAKNDYADDSEKYLELLNKAIAIDSNYFEPKVLRISLYYNMGDYRKADSLRLAIADNSKMNKRLKNLLNFYKALLNGENNKIYTTLKREYEYEPFDLQINKSFMVIALQFVNKPEEIDPIFFEISTKDIDMALCSDCMDRLYVKVLADLQLKRYDSVINFLTPYSSGLDKLYLKRPLIFAYLKTNRDAEAEDILNRLKIGADKNVWQNTFLAVGKQLLLMNRKEDANKYFDEIVKSSNELADNKNKAHALYYLEDYKAAEPLFQKLYNEVPSDYNYLVKLATTYYKNGKKQEANTLISLIDSLRGDYQFGGVDYALAQYYAKINDENNTMKQLMKSIAAGNLYTMTSYQNDSHFISYLDKDTFKSVLNFWKD